MSQQTSFNSAWLQEELFKPWLGTVEKDNHKARCIVCGLTFELSNMGKQALISHSKGKKHVKKMKYASKTATTEVFLCAKVKRYTKYRHNLD